MPTSLLDPGIRRDDEFDNTNSEVADEKDA